MSGSPCLVRLESAQESIDVVLELQTEVGARARGQHASKEGNSAGFPKPHPKSKCNHVCAM